MQGYDPLDTEVTDKARSDSSARDKLAQKTEAEDLKWLMSSKQGRRTVARILERAGIYRLSFNTNSMTMAFAEGARSEGLYFRSLLLRYCPDMFHTMLKESNE